jgi:hypothetical protein
MSFLSFTVHIPDEQGNAKFLITDEYKEVLSYALHNCAVTGLSCHGAVHHAVREIACGSGLPCRTAMHDRAGYIVDAQAKPSPKVGGRLICAYDYDYDPSMVNDFQRLSPVAPSVRPDGRVVPCCMDFGMKHVLGNLLEQSWDEIRRNEAFINFMRGFDEEGDTLCRSCSSAVSVSRLPAWRLKQFLQGENPALRQKLLEKDPAGVLRKLLQASGIAIMGLGKVFTEHYFTDLWDEAFEAVAFVDNNAALWGKTVRGMMLPSKKGVAENPAVLREHPGIFVVTFVGDAGALGRQLDEMEIEHANIFDIFSLLKNFA